jgi:hypothetical protein
VMDMNLRGAALSSGRKEVKKVKYAYT